MKDAPPRDSRLEEALSRLPRERSSPEFTARVLAALDRPTVRPRPARAAWAAVVSVVLIAGLGLGYGLQRQYAAERAYRQQVEELQHRYQQLLEEVTTVRQEVARPETRIYLGGDERLDLVLDLGQIEPTAALRRESSQVRPASLDSQ